MRINVRPNSLAASVKPLSVSSQLATLPVLSFNGEKIGKTQLNLKTAPPDTARTVVHRAIITDLQPEEKSVVEARNLTHRRKTGRARRGSNQTPLRPGSGVIFRTKPRDLSLKDFHA